MGSEISPEQIALLVERNTRFITLLMDGDCAGRDGRKKITALLAERFWVCAPQLPNGEKPDSVFELYLADLKNRFFNRRPQASPAAAVPKP
jgi:DNA primase